MEWHFLLFLVCVGRKEKMKFQDFQCGSCDFSGEIIQRLAGEGEFEFPEVYRYWKPMVELALSVKERSGLEVCELPFCHTVEAEAMNGSISYGDEKIGPRKKEFVCKKVEDILELPHIDASKGRIHEVLLACQELKKRGERVMLQVSGPLTILDILIDIKYIFKVMQKEPELIKKIFDRISSDLIEWIKEAKNYGVDIISYADSIGSMNILGPKRANWVVENFTYKFLKELDLQLDKQMLILLCPKTTVTLLEAGRITFEEIELSRCMYYEDVWFDCIGKVRFLGQLCTRNRNYEFKNKKVKTIKIL